MPCTTTGRPGSGTSWQGTLGKRAAGGERGQRSAWGGSARARGHEIARAHARAGSAQRRLEGHKGRTGAGAGAITGFQLSSVTGPGVAVGAGFGAVAGGIQGLIQDKNEEHDLKLAAELKKERERAYVHAILEEHYKRRLELHPTRDIYPADLFFLGDQANLKKESHALVEEIARLNKERFPWSRLVIACYAKSIDPESEFTQTLCERRSRDIADNLVRGGLEPRRLVTRSVIIDSPLLVDPLDQDAGRYNQAIEIIPIDR